MKHARVVVGCLFFVWLSGCSQPGDAVANLADLQPGWNVVEPGGDTVCSDGSPYRFFARPGNPAKLLVYFQGGGSCWDGLTCDADLEPTPYTMNLDGVHPRQASGIFDFVRPDNPFSDHSVVFAPYCSADVHLGDRITNYESPTRGEHVGHGVTIAHKGMVNAEAVLGWTYERFLQPDSIFVAGSSAGSIPSPYYAMQVAEHYPAATVAQLGDGSSGYRRDGMSVTPEAAWGALERLRDLAEFANLEVGAMTFELLYIAAANRKPEVSFAAFDHAEDAVQKQFLALAGASSESLLPLILANQSDVRESVAGFRSFIAGGDLHTILLRPEFYTQHVDGSSIRDWVQALVDRQPVADVRCTLCAVGEYLDSP